MSIELPEEMPRLVENNRVVLLKETELAEHDSIDVRNVSFREDQEQVKSTLVARGKVVFEDFPGAEREIAPRSFIEIDESAVLRITQMTIKNDGIQLSLAGKVDKLKIGPRSTEEDLVDRLPSRLDWLRSMPSFALIITIVVGILVNVLTHIITSTKNR